MNNAFKLPAPGTSLSKVGALGKPAARKALDAAEAGPVPIEFAAVTEQL